MSTQMLPPASSGVLDTYNRPSLQLPDEFLPGISLQAPGSFFAAETLFRIPSVEKEVFNDQQRQAFDRELSFLGLLLKANDLPCYEHSTRVKELAHLFLEMIHLAPEDAMIIEAAALLHDIGKIIIDVKLLAKSVPLSAGELEIMKKHPAFGAMILQQFKTMKCVMPLVYHHHERWDGHGYPCGLRGKAILPGARIVAIIDAFDAMTSQRPYQSARMPDQALAELRACAGTQFDPLLVRQFCDGLETSLLAR
ncbi:MAG TPA: HD domain-containing phosphohydrolase [Ktedonobacteraceae bacterium]|nr:HD domain-containing phosphohydrolase [Ktedonobacteraceae bacterium]